MDDLMMGDLMPSAFPLLRLTIDQEAISENYRRLKKSVGSACALAGVVKADAYGVGIEAAVPALEKEDCPFYYVAQLPEAFHVRRMTTKPIAVLGGAPRGSESEFSAHGFLPVLNSLDDILAWTHGPSIWHIDTGMNRLGLHPADVPKAVAASPLRPDFIMTHFVAADVRDSYLGTEQVRRFDEAARYLPGTPQSLCNSSALLRDATWHRQQARPGMALYGLNPTPETTNPMKAVVQLEAQIIQIHQAAAWETIGYNATYTLMRPSVLATVGIGYADGFLRSGSSKAFLYWNGQPCPVLGRVSMDLVIVDLTDLAQANLPPPVAGDWMEVLGPHQSADQLAASFGTIGYEVLTSLSRRAERRICTSA